MDSLRWPLDTLLNFTMHGLVIAVLLLGVAVYARTW